MLKGWWVRVLTTVVILEVIRGSTPVSCQHLTGATGVNISCVLTTKLLKTRCSVCFKQIVRLRNMPTGRGGPRPNKASSVHRGCMPLEEVRKHNWTIGTCFDPSYTTGDDFTIHFQCLCNDRDQCNSVGWLKPVSSPYYLIFFVVAITINL